MRRFVALVFATLVAATFGAFFVAQRLKASPAVIGEFHRTRAFSPNGDGRFEVARLRFTVRRADSVTVAVIDAAGDTVRELVSNRPAERGRPVPVRWDGRDDAGRRVPDGEYRYRVTLRREGRSVLVPRPVLVDTRPPALRVHGIGPERGPQAELLPRPGGGAIHARVRRTGRQREILLFRMAPGPVRLVRRDPLRDRAGRWTWDGRDRAGRPATPGTYLVAIRGRDVVGNAGAYPALGRDGLPATAYGLPLAGHGGITVRYLAAQAPLEPALAGRPVEFRVDARQRPWRWRVRRLGSRTVLAAGRKTNERLRVRAPGRAGVYLFEAFSRGRAVRVPFAVDGAARAPVLLVLPAITWQGRNPVDDDGDGRPDVLDSGLPAKLARVFAGDGLPAGFVAREAPLLAWLQRVPPRPRRARAFDVTTDVALARGLGAPLAGHRGVVLSGDARWLPRSVQEGLRRYVDGGGRLLSPGIDALRRQVDISADGRLVDPSPPASVDLFGVRPGALERSAAPVELTGELDRIGLFRGTTGAFGGWHAFQPLPADRRFAATAVTGEGRPVLAAQRAGRGLLLRFGLPELPERLARGDPDVTALMERTWKLLSR